MFNNSMNIYPQRDNLSTDSMCFSSDCRSIELESSSGSSSHQDKVNVDTRDSAIKFNVTPLSHMTKELDRLNSFNKSRWMKYMVDPHALSSAGFYYTGVDDKVKCFSCGGIIGDWNFTDNPWDEHAFWFPDCKFVLQEKGPIFVASIKKHWGQHLKMLSYDKQKEGYDTTDLLFKKYIVI